MKSKQISCSLPSLVTTTMGRQQLICFDFIWKQMAINSLFLYTLVKPSKTVISSWRLSTKKDMILEFVTISKKFWIKNTNKIFKAQFINKFKLHNPRTDLEYCAQSVSTSAVPTATINCHHECLSQRTLYTKGNFPSIFPSPALFPTIIHQMRSWCGRSRARTVRLARDRHALICSNSFFCLLWQIFVILTLRFYTDFCDFLKQAEYNFEKINRQRYTRMY